uniref:serine-protein kinase ATM-like isoform X2 n=1 Tax=Myxine glutinosa TaxID=7769 RepID=UPI00358DFB11
MAIPTKTIEVDPSGEYPHVVTVLGFMDSFHLIGGINLPKIVGNDDLRQDAVMQQVFHLCNGLLSTDREAQQRRLKIRTYKVVPLTRQSGLLEWCEGTLPLGAYLVEGTKNAHTRYRPSDWTDQKCRKTMNEVQGKSAECRQATYSKVLQHFRPVFRHFFLERFPEPCAWFERRLAYTRSTATSSIVAYMLGLGDRHVNNILVHESTAELVHIDLGVAFEQGRILPTPETVPFRLTRDLVDGMGITGVEGVFRRCCEKTLQVMRNNQEALITIVEVLLYDPLYEWTMTPLKALTLQGRVDEDPDMQMTDPKLRDLQQPEQKRSDSKRVNQVAERVLLRLGEKLRGVESGSALSVSGQINLLIQQAQDINNLSCLFPGWKPWV